MNVSNTERPLVSVIVPTYNDEGHLRETLESILRQTYRNIEVIVVDDCSTDGSRDVVSRLDNDRVIGVVNEENIGPAGTRNRGIDIAKGDYIAFCDGDDIWSDDKLERQIAFMASNNIAFTYTKYDVIDERGQSYSSSGNIPLDVSYQELLSYCFIRTSSVVYRPSAVGGKHYFPPLRKRQDFGLFLSLLRSAPRAYLIDDYLCSYRVRRASVSSNKFKNIPFQWLVYRQAERISVMRSAVLMIRWFISAAMVAVRRRTDRIRVEISRS